MSLLIDWQGRQVDVDPEEFSTLELGEVKKRTGMDYPDLIQGVISGNGDAIRALFWVVDRRDDPALKFDGYAGPSMRVWKQLLAHFAGLIADLGKATDAADKVLTGNAGSAGSPSSTDSDPTSSTD